MIVEQSKQIIEEVGKAFIGKTDLVEKVLMTIYAGGHVLLEDCPGVGKTTLAMAFSKALGLQNKRIQFTPDTLPSDITGFTMYNRESNRFEYRDGAANCQLLLADEINRTSPKTQSALLEVMEEHTITVDGKTHALPTPFLCIATQNPQLRARFSGKPEFVINYLRFVAQETREILASLGLRSLDEAVGRADLLSVNRAIDFYKARHLDFSSILHAAEGDGRRFDPSFEKEPLDNYDRRHLLPALKPLLEKGEKTELCRDVRNVDRTVGTELSGELVMKFGPRGLAEDTLTVHFTGCAGQSFGAFLAPGVTFELVGEANDFVGKGLSGGKIIVRPPDHISYVPSDNVIAGNVIGYGATSGSIFLHGQAGERFAIRNSGAKMVVEGIGDHGCEYMTGGRVAVLGKVGVNFAAGMTGGLAYVYDADNNFDQKCNLGSVDLETVMPHSADEAELLQLIYEHYMATRSRRAYDLLNNWPEERGKFIKVFPVEYRHALAMHS